MLNEEQIVPANIEIPKKFFAAHEALARFWGAEFKERIQLDVEYLRVNARISGLDVLREAERIVESLQGHPDKELLIARISAASLEILGAGTDGRKTAPTSPTSPEISQ